MVTPRTRIAADILTTVLMSAVLSNLATCVWVPVIKAVVFESLVRVCMKGAIVPYCHYLSTLRQSLKVAVSGGGNELTVCS